MTRMIKSAISNILERSNYQIRKLHKPELFFSTVPVATVIDVGANVGQFAHAIRDVQPSCAIHSFEPVPSAATELRESFLGDRKFFSYEVAISDREGETRFEVNEFSHSSSILPITDKQKKMFPFASTTKQITVQVTTLDRWLNGKDLQRPVLLKLDVQGNELAALQGARALLSETDYILTEVNFFNLYHGQPSFDDLYNVISPLGFQLADFYPGILDRQQRRALYGDALFLKNIADLQ
jgi:FkbM family methyltransferase